MGVNLGKFSNAGWYYGFASLLGYRDLVDPVAKNKQQIADLNDQTQQYLNVGTLAALREGTQIQQDLYQLLNNKQSELRQFVNYNNELLWEEVREDNMFIVILFITLLVVIFFDLFFSR